MLLTELPNIGSKLAKDLQACGIHTAEDLRNTGTQQVFLRLYALDSGACFSKLCAIEGAVQGVRWHELPASAKAELKEFFYQIKKI